MKLLRPHKLKDLRKEPIVVAYYIDKFLHDNHGNARLQELIEFLKKKLHINEDKFMLGLNFLYILGKIEYIKDRDEIRKIG